MIKGMAILVGLVAAPAWGEVITFRSGDHPGFARLVIDMPEGTAWGLGRAGGDYALDLPGATGFDLAGAFDRIPRTRLRAIDTFDAEARLLLRLACECHANAFLFEPGKLVVDIIDGPAPPDSPWETPVDAPVMTNPTEFPLVLPAVPPASFLFDPAVPPEASASPNVNPFAMAMSDAIAAGLLAPARPEPPTIPSAIPVAADVAEPPASAGQIGPGISFITASDALRQAPGPRALSRSGHPCRPDAEFDLAAWGPTGDFDRDIGVLRRAVINGAHEPKPEAVLALAHAYLHFGFGAEAAQVLTSSGQDSAEIRQLQDLASLIDDRPVASGAFSGQEGCLSAVALWSALARRSIAGRDLTERTAIESAFLALPPAPRKAVAPRLAAAFLAAGQAESAAAILARLPGQSADSDSVLTVTSDVIRDTASAAAARATLLDAIRNGSRTTPGTMIRLVEATIEADQPVDLWMIDTLASLRFEYQASPIAETLVATQIRALIATRRFAEAESILRDSQSGLAPTASDGLADLYLQAVTDEADDPAFLRTVLDPDQLLATAPTENRMAERLIALGFPDAALSRLMAPASGDTMRDRRLLRARALRDLGQHEEATLILAGMATGSPAVPDSGDAWRAGDWDRLASDGDFLLASAAAAMRESGPPGPVTDLADRAALLNAAEETRTLVTELLSRFPPPPATPVPDTSP